MEESERLTLKVWETEHGWAYMVYSGDGNTPGCVHGAAGACSLEDAVTEGHQSLKRAIKVRECEHEYQPWGGTGHFKQCQHCDIVVPLSGSWV